ncbi:MAG TPA: hypothetical protein VHN14_34585 [Kofleriaceae bacterium]|nr:hypothetical protein [Kofleriaceae bacterium]
MTRTRLPAGRGAGDAHASASEAAPPSSAARIAAPGSPDPAWQAT